MSLTGFQRYRRLQQIEEMRPENIDKVQDEEAKEKIGNEPTVEDKKEDEVIEAETVNDADEVIQPKSRKGHR